MNISGLLILSHPEKIDQTAESLKSFPGLEIHKVLEGGKIVAVLERETTGEEVQAVKEINNLNGVINASMVYHNFEDEIEAASNKP